MQNKRERTYSYELVVLHFVHRYFLVEISERAAAVLALFHSDSSFEHFIVHVFWNCSKTN